MNLTTVTPKKSINKAFLKERVSRADMELFKAHFKLLLDRIEAVSNESEENRKNSVSDFLKSAHFSPAYEINTKGREDLVIHTGKTAKDSVGVVFEIKKPDSSEMMTAAKPNAKALQQLVFYYLRERIEHKNLDIKHLIATDIFNWYIFDENLFDKHIYRNPKFQKGYETFKQSGKDTAFFYNEVAKPLLDDLGIELECTHFNLKSYEKAVKNDDEADDTSLIALYKILSPTHLLKLPFANDSNSLDKNFYAELLHIIGLEEVKEGSKKLINRKAKPDEFSLLENTITKIENKGFSEVSNLAKLGSTRAEQTFSIALELCITWVNRILFLKLLEAQLISYHKGDSAYRFLNPSVIYDCDRLNKLFFEVLAEKTENRKGKVKAEFEKIPYLNSSLFERTELERKTIEINYLDDNELIPILSNTVLKDDKGKKRTGSLPTLLYLFEFLDAFDFASEGSEGIQDDKRTLINASVLGLIFEKINGYKDGSFFTPGFITMYMCRETIRRAVVQKFKDTTLKEFATLGGFEDLKDAITDRKQANDIINSLKICDPAVGSGHFLVSALNEIIALKSDLGVLQHRDGSRVKHYKVEIQNDELIVTDEENGDIFQYTVNALGVAPREVQQLQETLFHEKQLLIENCLFGVDINPNSVKICRLRLWIELLKNAYYVGPSVLGGSTAQSPITQSPNHQLETLPNIDINIKQGNSLISRFKLDDDLSEVFKKQKFSYKAYRKTVEDYKNTNSKDAKAELLKYLDEIKEQFQAIFTFRHPLNNKLKNLKAKLYFVENPSVIGNLFEKNESKETLENIEKLKKQVEDVEYEIKEVKNNIIYRDAFEWRFEFPEVLDNDGGYLGFDVVIGNPPYIRAEEIGSQKESLKTRYDVFSPAGDIFSYFYELSNNILNSEGNFCFINNTFDKTSAGKTLRFFINENFKIRKYTDLTSVVVFEEATTYPIILEMVKGSESKNVFNYLKIEPANKTDLGNENQIVKINQNALKDEGWNFINEDESIILSKLNNNKTVLDLYGKCYYGIKTGLNEAFIIDFIKDNFDILKPVYEGKDLKKWVSPSPTKKMIVLESKSTKKKFGSNIETTEALEKLSTAYPSVFSHLLSFEKAAQIRYDKGDFWWELRNCAYYDLFEKPKIIFPNLQNTNKFAFDDSATFLNAPAVFLPTEDKFLLGILNSKLVWYFLRSICVVRSGGYIEVKPQYFEQIPIVQIPESEQQPLITLVEEIIAIKKATPSVSTAEKEGEIDRLVYGLYGLTEEEINIIEQSIK